jgi:hypothetical protein
MKLIFILLMFVALNVGATDYTIVKSGDNCTIYTSSVSSNNTVYITEYKLVEPFTISQLQSIRLPKELWYKLDDPDGVYDTRLAAVQQTLIDADNTINSGKEYIDELEFRIVVGILFSIIIIGLLVYSLILVCRS